MIIPITTPHRTPRITSAQIRYLDILFNDCGFGASRQQRNAWLTRVLEREIHYLDDLSCVEASAIIQVLVTRRDRDKTLDEEEDE